MVFPTHLLEMETATLTPFSSSVTSLVPADDHGKLIKILRMINAWIDLATYQVLDQTSKSSCIKQAQYCFKSMVAAAASLVTESGDFRKKKSNLTQEIGSTAT
jgi:hypothetical protein